MLTTVKVEINSNTVIVGDFNTPLTPMYRSHRQKINKKALNDTLDQFYLIDTYMAFYPKTIDFTSVYLLNRFLKCIWNILQDRSDTGPQIKPW